MTAEMGMNLAGVERVFELEDQLAMMNAKVRRLERRATALAEEVERLEELRRSLRAEIVPYVRGGAIVPVQPQTRFRIPIERPAQDGGGA
jgi:MerR family transcriptional regulator/heat shock protein HspR